MPTKCPDAGSLGLYEILPSLLVGGNRRVEWGIVEHRLHQQHPDLYNLLYEAYGHVTQGPRRYSVSSYLARRMGFLASKGVVVCSDGPATGLWEYDRRVSYWTLPNQGNQNRYTWAAYATDRNLVGEWWEIIGRTGP